MRALNSTTKLCVSVQNIAITFAVDLVDICVLFIMYDAFWNVVVGRLRGVHSLSIVRLFRGIINKINSNDSSNHRRL